MVGEVTVNLRLKACFADPEFALKPVDFAFLRADTAGFQQGICFNNSVVQGAVAVSG